MFQMTTNSHFIRPQINALQLMHVMVSLGIGSPIPSKLPNARRKEKEKKPADAS